MSEQLFAFACGSTAPKVLVLDYPGFNVVNDFEQPGAAAQAVGFTVGGAFLGVIQDDDGSERFLVYNTETWQREEVAFTWTSGGFTSGVRLMVFPASETAFYVTINGSFIVERDRDGVWQVRDLALPGPPRARPYTTASGAQKVALMEEVNTPQEDYRLHVYDVATASTTQVTLPARDTDSAWYSAFMSPTGKHCALLRRVGPWESYEWDTLVLETDTWTVVAEDLAWQTQNTSVSSIDGVPYLSPDDTLLMLPYYDGVSGKTRAYDVPGMALRAASDLQGIEVSNYAEEGLRYMPDSSLAVIASVGFGEEGSAAIALGNMTKMTPFPFGNVGTFNGTNGLVTHDSVYLINPEQGAGEVRIYDNVLVLETTIAGGVSAHPRTMATAQLTYSLPAPPRIPVRYLEKLTNRTYEPGSPGVPATPGTPPSAPHSGSLTTTTSKTRAIVPAGKIREFLNRNDVSGAHIAVFGTAADGTVTYYAVTYTSTTQVTESSTVNFPSSPGTPPTPGVPPTPGSWRIDRNFGWNAGARSIDRLDGDVSVTFRVDVASAVAVALARTAVTDFHYRGLPFVLLFRDGEVTVWESGIRRTEPLPFAPEDRFSISRIGGRVQYKQGNQVLYDNPDGGTGPLVVTAALYGGGDRVI